MMRSSVSACVVLLAACAGVPREATTLRNEALELVRAAEATTDPAQRVPLLEDARARLHRIVGLHGSTDAARHLLEGGPAEPLWLPNVERALVEARMDACRAAPDYGCLIENALLASAAPEYMMGDFGTAPGYPWIAVAQARIGDVAGADATLGRLADSGHPDADLVAESMRPRIAVLQAAFGQIDEAMQTAEHRHAASVRAAIAIAQARAGDTEAALAAADRIVGDTAGASEYEIERRRGYLLLPLALTRIGVAQAESGVSEEASETLLRAARSLEGVLTSGQNDIGTRLLRAIVSTLTEMGDEDVAEQVLLRARTAAAESEYAFARELSLLGIASVRAAIGDSARAVEVLLEVESEAARTARERGDSPWAPIQSYRNVILGWARIGEAVRAHELVDSLVTDAALSGRVSSTASRLLADLARLLAEAGDVDGAARTAERLDAVGLGGNRSRVTVAEERSRALAARVSVIEARARGGDARAALASAREITGELHPHHTAQMLTTVAASLADAGEQESARTVFAEAVAAAARVEFPNWPYAAPETGPHDPAEDFLADIMDAGRGFWLNTYLLRGWALRGIKCTAETAGLPIPLPVLRQAALNEEEKRYDANNWMLRAIALERVERPCPSPPAN